MQEHTKHDIESVPLDIQVADEVLKSLILPFSRKRLASGEATLSEIVESLKDGGRASRFLQLYIKRLKIKCNN
jgi:hypothetical protein